MKLRREVPLYLIIGKSTELVRRIRRFTAAKKKCIVLKHISDKQRNQVDDVTTHDLQTFKAVTYSTLTDFINHENLYHVDVIGIDEGQWFKDVVWLSEILANCGKIVIIAALDGSFQRKPFLYLDGSSILNLIPLAEEVIKLTAICQYCSKSASFTKRIVESKEIELIGGAESYHATCRACFYKEEEEKEYPHEKL